MPCITKIRTPAGTTRFRAIIKRDGKQVASKNFTTKTAATTWARRVEGDCELMAALGTPEGSKTFREAAKAMVKARPGRDPSRQARLDWWIEKIGDKLIGRIELADLKPHLDGYAETHQPATANRLRAAVSSVFKYARQQGWIVKNPAANLVHRTEDNKIVRWLTADEYTALLTACEAAAWRKLKLLVLTLCLTGARLSEALSLRWNDIDWGERTARLERTKNGSSRTLVFPEPLVAELRKHQQVGNGLIFGRADDPHRPHLFRREWYAAVKRSGITRRLRVHDLRHHHASLLAMAGCTLPEIMDALGHKSPAVTSRYMHLSPQHKRAVADRVFGGAL